MKSGIYVIRHTAGRSYVGSSVDIGRRWDLHRSQLRSGKHHCVKLQRAWNKYGEQAFEFSVLEHADHERLIEREQHWIDALNACRDGFNTLPAAGSARGHKWSREAIDKRNASLRGLKRSPEARARIGAAKKGKPMSEEQKAKLSAALKGRKRDPELVERTAAALRGRTRPQEVVEKVRASQIGKVVSEETRAKQSAAQRARFARQAASSS